MDCVYPEYNMVGGTACKTTNIVKTVQIQI